MTVDPATLPYRANVGAVLFNRDGLVFVGRRADIRDRATGAEIWQLPQGGIDLGESPRDAVFRELAEEIGSADATILAEHPDWLSYDFPAEMVGRVMGGRYRGQRQRWFALRFEGEDADIRLDVQDPPEFDRWRWIELPALATLSVGFKRATYGVLADSFARFAAR